MIGTKHFIRINIRVQYDTRYIQSPLCIVVLKINTPSVSVNCYNNYPWSTGYLTRMSRIRPNVKNAWLYKLTVTYTPTQTPTLIWNIKVKDGRCLEAL